MKLNALIYSRTDRQLLPEPPSAAVSHLSWTALGGAQSCQLTLESAGTAADLTRLLGSGVEVFDSAGRAVWWGYVESAACERHQVSMQNLSNHIRARYTPLTPGNASPETVLTEWAGDDLSQAVWGIRDRELHLGAISAEEALHRRDLALGACAWPKFSPAPAHDRPSAPTLVQLSCRGWFESLSARLWEGESGLLGHAAALQGSVSLSGSAGIARAAVAFELAHPAELLAAGLRVRRLELAADGLTAQVFADVSGIPGPAPLGSVVIPAALISTDSCSWTEGLWSAALALPAGRYWLVLQRTNPTAAGSYQLGADENLGNSASLTLVWDASGQSWRATRPEVDLLFKLRSARSSAGILAEMIALDGHGLRGLNFAAESRALTGPSPAGQSCLEVAHEVLSLGSAQGAPLRVTVSRAGLVHVEACPPEAAEEVRLSWDGTLSDRFGQQLPEGWLPVGVWAWVEGSGRMFISQAELNVENGQMMIR